jgi:hypothetical protein
MANDFTLANISKIVQYYVGKADLPDWSDKFYVFYHIFIVWTSQNWEDCDKFC